MTDLTLLCWNIDQARREEKVECTKWDRRSPGVKDLIKKCDADLVALIELRDLETSKEDWRTFLSSFPEYDFVARRYCHFHLSFAMCLLVNHTKFFVGDTRVHNFTGSPNDDKMIMFVDLQDKKSLKWFTVGVTHFDLPEKAKWESCHIVRQLIGQQKYPTMVYGDYNFFDDKDGTAQRNYMLERCKDIAFPLESAVGTLKGTFYGFPHDEFKKSNDTMSRLDHVFTPNNHNGIKITKPAISPLLNTYKLDNSNYETYTYPSDHLAILLECRLD